MAHVDVVPAREGEGWSVPPFEGRVADGRVWGRGALDDKGPLLVVLEAVEHLLAAGFSPARDVYLSFGGDDEVFGGAAEEIARTLAERGVAPWLVLALMATRPEAAQAYDSSAGLVMILGGAVVSVIAYRVMLVIARLPQDERVLR